MNATSRLNSEFRDDDGTACHPGPMQGGFQGRSTVEGVSALSCLNLDVFREDCHALSGGKGSNGGPLRLQAETRAALTGGGNSQIGDNVMGGHGVRVPSTTVARVLQAPLQRTAKSFKPYGGPPHTFCRQNIQTLQVT